MTIEWDRAVLATLRHSTLALGETLRSIPLGPDFGTRHKLSLLAQFVAHQALLQFAGIADTELEPTDWVVVRRRGSDPRLVRVGGRAATNETLPLLTLAQQFGDFVGVELPIFRQSWARAEAVYADAFAQAPEEWVRRSAYGQIASPGPDALRALKSGRYTYSDDECIESLTRWAADTIVFKGVSPLQRYSALGAYSGSESEVAEKINAAGRRIYVIANEAAFDEGSRRVIEILMSLDSGSTWIVPGANGLPETKHFVISPQLSAREALPSDRASLEAFVMADAFGAYLRRGDVPSKPAKDIAEPTRSYLGALAVLGNRVPTTTAKRFLAEFGFEQRIEDLLIDGVTSIDADHIVFHADIATPTLSICRVAANYVTDLDALHRFPPETLPPDLARSYAEALIAKGRYRDARDIAAVLPPTERERILAKAERRTGDYSIALLRLDRMPHRDDDARVLRAELLRLMHRHDEAAEEIARCAQSDRVLYERALIAFESGRPIEQRPTDPYLDARLAASIHEAPPSASLPHARTLPERIDALLDCMYVEFTAGRWTAARHLAIEALQLVGETQGDRAAGGILFLLAYLAADDGQIAQAQQHIARLRAFYGGTHDDLRLRELHLLDAQLSLAQGKLADARREALAIDGRDQIAEAAALILDELDLLEGRNTPLRSTGHSGNATFDARHAALQQGKPPHGTIQVQRHEPSAELTAIRAAALRDFPYGPHDFGVPWCFATRNRLGHWNLIGPHQPRDLDAILANGKPDWIVCSDRELLYLEGSHLWPPDSQDTLGAIVRTRAENARLRRITESDDAPSERAILSDHGIIGDSPAIRELHARIARIAKRDVPVCILGESGTGKELVARAIHKSSTRRGKPFTAVNCAALPENLIESELFGHMRGAFTGADRDRAGLIETTDGGTLFLDEIGELPLAAQAKLLRFLQEGEFRRVGDTVNRTADVRVVSATNRKLESSVEEGLFREDLYYRIRGIDVALPPLRERGADVLILARHFLAHERDKHRGGAQTFSDEVESLFIGYPWPGNVRELQNTILAAHTMAGDARAIRPEHLPERLRTMSDPTNSYQDAVLGFRRNLIERSLSEAGGNQNRAAAILRISRQALAYQIRELGILVRKRNDEPTL